MQTEEHKQEKEPQKDLNVVWSIFHERMTSIFFLPVILLVFILAILMAGHVHNFDKHNFANPPVNSFFNIFIIFSSCLRRQNRQKRVGVVVVVVVVGSWEVRPLK